METIIARIKASFAKSRKLSGFDPSKDQLTNALKRLRQIFTDQELQQLDGRQFVRQVERVWPVARYVDRINKE